MSYILEALKRAEAERDRGAVPTLHSQPLAPSAAAPGAPHINPWIGALSALLVLALVVIATLWWRGHASADSAPVATTVVPAPMQAPAVATAAPTTTRPAPPPARPKPTPRPAPAAPATPASPAVRTTPKAVAPPPAPAAVAEAPSRIYTLAELPGNVRQKMPKLNIGGASYSAQPAYRMLIVNGQVFHEKDEITAGLVLESIGPKSAVLRFNGYRFSQGF